MTASPTLDQITMGLLLSGRTADAAALSRFADQYLVAGRPIYGETLYVVVANGEAPVFTDQQTSEDYADDIRMSLQLEFR